MIKVSVLCTFCPTDLFGIEHDMFAWPIMIIYILIPIIPFAENIFPVYLKEIIAITDGT